MASPSPPSVTHLLNAWSAGDEAAGQALIEIVYKELRRMAARYMQDERTDHTLQPTALVHELYVKLFSSHPITFRNRGHFFAVAARQLRHLVVDYARSEGAQKRGGAQVKVALDDVPDQILVLDQRILDLDQALERFSRLDARSAQVIELHYFAGLTHAEIAETLEVSVATVKRDWEFARSWLLKEIGNPGPVKQTPGAM
jgi:RNA polymerase sigma factor (TIGR02999 family)